MRVYPLSDLLSFARTHSPYYQKLWSAVPELKLENLPLVVPADFWAANSWNDNKVFTGKVDNGIVFKSGGTTGAPKFSVFTQEEWNSFCEEFGRGLRLGGLQRGEKVANLFYAGDLYASFLFILKSLENAGVPTLQFPVSGAVEPKKIIELCVEFGITTLAGVPTTILNVAEELGGKPHPQLQIKKILFGGESMYPDQRELLAKLFPGCTIQSIGYASVDAGLIGYATPDCEIDHHYSFSQSTVLEILDPDTGAPILEDRKPGKIVLTNLTRNLMPIIRYPVGDMGEWLGPLTQGDRRYRLLGRSEDGARVGPVTLYYEDVHAIVQKNFPQANCRFQLVIRHQGLLDELEIRIHANDLDAAAFASALKRERPFLEQAIQENKIHPLRLTFTPSLEGNPRTGKLKRIIDLRK